MLRDLDKNKSDQLSMWCALKYGIGVVKTVAPGQSLVLVISAIGTAMLTSTTVVILGLVIKALNSEAGISGSVDAWVLLVSLSVLAGVLLVGLQKYARLRISDSLSIHMQSHVLKHASLLDASVIENPEAQNILERAGKQPGQSILGLLDGSVKSISGTIRLLSLGAIMLWIEPLWTSVMIVSAIPLIVAAHWMSRMRYAHHRIKSAQRRWSRYYSRLVVHRDWVLPRTMLDLRELMLDRHKQQMTDIADDNRRVGGLEIVVNLGTSLVMVLIMAGAIWYATQKASRGMLEIGMFAAFWTAAFQFSRAANDFGSSFSKLLNARFRIQDLHEFFKLTPQLKDRGTKTPRIEGEIEVEDLSFRFGPELPLVLENVSFTIKPGEIVALVGPNGSGKSTLAKLLARLYDPTEGKIRFDGLPAREISLHHLQKHISFMFQQVPRFEATAEEVIAFGDWRNLMGESARIRQIAIDSGVDPLIESLPQGYDTKLGRTFGDCDLSGGQWQKMILAQTLAADPTIIILDEPAASLDLESERVMHQQLRNLLWGRTTILISHRFSSVQMADRIIVLLDGRIAEQGTHEELYNMQGVYASMCRTYQGFFTNRSGLETRHSQASDSLYEEHQSGFEAA